MASNLSEKLHPARVSEMSPLKAAIVGNSGDGGDGSGRNMPGRILMDVRNQMRTSDDNSS